MPDNFKRPILRIRLTRKSPNGGHGSWIDFRTESNLIRDEKIAFDLLHFLYHLDGASFECLEASITDFERRSVNQPLNPFIFELLNMGKGEGQAPFRIYARTLRLSTLVEPTQVQMEEVRKVMRTVIGRPTPRLELYGTNGAEFVPWGVL